MEKKEVAQLRDSIKQKLENAEFEGRIKIDKDVLEKLLFDDYWVRVYYSGLNNSGERTSDYMSVRIPIWSGKFLQKIDLSEVNFDNVFWGDGIQIETDERKKVEWRRYICDYSNTNANIDLGKACPIKGYGRDNKEYDVIYIWNCNFENLDLSKNNFNGKFLRIQDTNLANTKIKISPNEIGCIYDCNMDNNDLSDITVDLFNLMAPYLEVDDITYAINNSMNTGLKIVCNKDSMSCSSNRVPEDWFNRDESIEGFWETFDEFFNNYDFVGCYFNGTLIESKEQLIELSTNTMKKLIDDYTKTSTEYKMNHLLNSIDEQIDSKKKQDLNDMLNDKVEMIESSIDEQIKSKQ